MSLVQHKWDQMALSFRTFFELRRQIDGVQKLVKDRGHVSEKNGFAPQSDGKQWLVRDTRVFLIFDAVL